MGLSDKVKENESIRGKKTDKKDTKWDAFLSYCDAKIEVSRTREAK